MTIRIFDFDRTVTKKHTFADPLAYSANSNIKEGIEEYFIHDKNDIAAIATYHDNPKYVKTYVEKILGKTLTLKETLTFEHDVLSVYEVEGQNKPLLLSTLHEEDFNFHHQQLRAEGKNTQIRHILAYLREKHKIDVKNHDVKFFDDDENNFKNAQDLADETHGIESNLIDKTITKTFYIEKTVNSLPNIANHAIDDETSINKRVKATFGDYKANTDKIKTWFSLFHRHGKTGINRANAFLNSLDDLDELSIKIKVLSYLGDETNGNTNPHSFRTMLLKELLDAKSSTLDSISADYHTSLNSLKSQWEMTGNFDSSYNY